MSKMTEMNVPSAPEAKQDMTHHTDIGNNLGELFKKEKVESKSGTKIRVQKENLDEAKLLLKALDMSDNIETAKTKAKEIVKALYTGKSLVDQFGYLDRKRSTKEIVSQMYSIFINKQEWYEKNLEVFTQEMEGN